MTTSGAASTSPLVRLTVASGTRRVDLALPGAVPVAELVPELARSVGLLDPAPGREGYQLVTVDGRWLTSDAGLVAQGVEDGGLLTIAATGGGSVRVYDDVADAMADAVELRLRTWDPAADRPIAVGVAGLLLALGGVGLLGQPAAWLLSAALAAVAATGAVTLSRVRRETVPAVVAAWLAAVYAAVAGVLAVAAEPPSGQVATTQAAAAGAAAALVGVLCLIGLDEGRAWLIPAVVDGAILSASGLLARAAGVDLSAALLSALTVVVLGSSAFPRLALAMAGAPVGAHVALADPPDEPWRVDPDRVADDARLAHQLLVALSLTAGVLVLVVAPVAVARGVPAAGVVVLCCLVVLLRTRQHRTSLEVLAGAGAGITGLVVTALSALWLHAEWRPVLAPALAGAGVVVLAVTIGSSRTSVRRSRLGDLAESVALAALPLVLVIANGWLPWLPALPG